MVSKSKIQERLKVTKYPNKDAYVEHVIALSEEIQEGRKSKAKKPPEVKEPYVPKSDFLRAVHAIASKHIHPNGTYNITAIGLAVTGKKKDELDEEEKAKLALKVNNAIAYLAQKGVITRSRPTRLPALREATSTEIEKHIRLIHFILNHGHRYLPGDWRRYLKRKEAVDIGKQGLAIAISRFDPSRGVKFSPFAANHIAGEISNNVRKLRQQEKGTTPRESAEIDRANQQNENTEGKKPYGEIDLPQLFKLHKQQKVTAPEIAVIGLRLMGHSHREIGKYFNMGKTRIQQIEKRATQKLKK